MTHIVTQGTWQPEEAGTSSPKTVTLYQNHSSIVEELCRREKRTFSNGLQVIIEQWYDAVAYSEWAAEDYHAEKASVA